MKLFAYFCSSDLCCTIRECGHIRAVCAAHAVELAELDGSQISRTHKDLAEAAGLAGFPLFIAEDGPHFQVFDSSGWSDFERKLRGDGLGK